jgi:hypothetical protein
VCPAVVKECHLDREAEIQVVEGASAAGFTVTVLLDVHGTYAFFERRNIAADFGDVGPLVSSLGGVDLGTFTDLRLVPVSRRGRARRLVTA